MSITLNDILNVHWSPSNLDDIWVIWTEDHDSLKYVHCLTNSVHARIQVDLRHSTQKIEFLNVLTSIENHMFKTDLFTKPTDKHLY